MVDLSKMPADQWRAGDHVLHRPSGETWVLAYVDGDHLAWCGWPAGEAKISDCELVRRATDDEHTRLLRDLAKGEDKRASRARSAISQPERKIEGE